MLRVMVVVVAVVAAVVITVIVIGRCGGWWREYGREEAEMRESEGAQNGGSGAAKRRFREGHNQSAAKPRLKCLSGRDMERATPKRERSREHTTISNDKRRRRERWC